MASKSLHHDYPWIASDAPLVVTAPMMNITLAKVAVAASAAGGIGFLAGGFDLSSFGKNLAEAAEVAKQCGLPLTNNVLPIGVGFQNWGADLSLAIEVLSNHPVAVAWFFAPQHLSDLLAWTREIRAVTHKKTKIWIQVGTVAEALEVAKTSKPDVLVIQGADAGGHGLAHRAGITTLLPEVVDRLAAEGFSIPLIAAGGIIDARGAAAALVLGADGICLGTRVLACEEAVIAKGYQNEILRVHDGGVSTVGTTIYDTVRGITGWPSPYIGRGVANRSYLDAVAGMDDTENKELYEEAKQMGDGGWGPEGRMTTYAGTGVGLVHEVKPVREVIEEVRQGALEVLLSSASRYQKTSV